MSPPRRRMYLSSIDLARHDGLAPNHHRDVVLKHARARIHRSVAKSLDPLVRDALHVADILGAEAGDRHAGLGNLRIERAGFGKELGRMKMPEPHVPLVVRDSSLGTRFAALDGVAVQEVEFVVLNPVAL